MPQPQIGVYMVDEDLRLIKILASIKLKLNGKDFTFDKSMLGLPSWIVKTSNFMESRFSMICIVKNQIISEFIIGSAKMNSFIHDGGYLRSITFEESNFSLMKYAQSKKSNYALILHYGKSGQGSSPIDLHSLYNIDSF